MASEETPHLVDLRSRRHNPCLMKDQYGVMNWATSDTDGVGCPATSRWGLR